MSTNENEVVVTEEVVEKGVQPRNKTEKTWPAFEDRWENTILGKLVKDLEGVLSDMHEVSIEFNMQQLVNAQNYVGMAIGELRKCIGYEESNLTSTIGPRPVVVIAPVVEDEVIVPPVVEPVVEPTPTTPSINLFKTPTV